MNLNYNYNVILSKCYISLRKIIIIQKIQNNIVNQTRFKVLFK